MLSITVFATQKQIIIGSYLDEKNAINELKELSLHVEKDERLKSLVDKNSLISKAKKIEGYYVVALLPLPSYVQLLRTLESIQKYYPDAYVLDAPEIVAVVKPEEIKVEVIEKKETAPVKKAKVIMKQQEQKDDKKFNTDYLLILLALALLGFGLYKRKKAKKEE